MSTPASTPSRPIRTKRNFKALALDVATPAPPPNPEPELIPTRAAPAPLGGPALGAPPGKPAGKKKRPPPMQLKTPKAVETPTGEDGASFARGAGSALPSTAAASASGRQNYHATLSSTLANLDMNATTKYDLRDEDLKDLNELGQGNGGSVKMVEHVPTHTIMAKKVCAVSKLRLGLVGYDSDISYRLFL